MLIVPDQGPTARSVASTTAPRSAGIVTFHWAHNYGAVLQAYALCDCLNRAFSVKTLVVDFTTSRQRKINRILPSLQSGPDLSRRTALFILKLFHYPTLHCRKRRFERFLKTYVNCTRPYVSIDDLRTDPPHLDALFSGSDQVFNSDILPPEELAVYCLEPFPQGTRRIAFAPSFGGATILTDKARHTMTEHLRRFDNLSSREAEGSALIQSLIGRPVPTVIDPVFLLTAAEWHALASGGTIKGKDYILCYALNGRSSLNALVRKLNALTTLPVVLLTSNVRSRIRADVTRYDAGPREFLELFAKARYVVTDSFHGTAFSILLEKDFYSHQVSRMGGQRIINLLHRLGLSERLAHTPDEIVPATLAVDYSLPCRKLAAERAFALTYLRDAIGGKEP